MSATPFYDSYVWRKCRKKIMEEDNNECQICKAAGRHTPGELVHHIFHFDEYPQYGLCKYVTVDGKDVRNLVTVCKACHETVCHPTRGAGVYKSPLTLERWD